MGKHVTVSTKVNAHVDAGIVHLVLALNRCSEILTLDSCEGDDNEDAHVYFRFVGSHEAPGFFFRLAEALAREATATYRLQLDWGPHNAEPMAQLTMPRKSIASVTRVVEDAMAPF